MAPLGSSQQTAMTLRIGQEHRRYQARTQVTTGEAPPVERRSGTDPRACVRRRVKIPIMHDRRSGSDRRRQDRRLPVRDGGPHDRSTSQMALMEAAERAGAQWRDPGHDGISREETSKLLAGIVDAIVEGHASVEIDGRLRSPAGRRLLEQFRSEVVHVWRDAEHRPPALEMLETLEAIESVSRALVPDGAEQFVDDLAEPEGLGLVVEVAHDLRSPLTSILFLAETLQRRLSGDINDLQHRQLGLIYSAALGLSEMASNVLELVRGGTRLAEDEPTPFSVREVLQSVLDIIRPMAEEKGLILRLNPPASDHRSGHPLALSRVLLNLTTNALKFTEDGFVEIVARETGRTRVEFSVRDSGRGISPTALEALYSPFRSRTHQGGSEFSATGLGLALCRRLVHAMGSELRVQSKPEWGTRFYFELDLPPILVLSETARRDLRSPH